MTNTPIPSVSPPLPQPKSDVLVMTPKELNAVVLADLRSFEAKYATKTRSPLIARFDSHFQSLHGVCLREAFRIVFNLPRKEMNMEKILAGIPGVEVFKGPEGSCVRRPSQNDDRPEPAGVAPVPKRLDPSATAVLKMSRDELKAVVAEEVRLFEAECARVGVPPKLDMFGAFFVVRRKIELQMAFRTVFGLSKKESSFQNVLTMVPGVQVTDCAGNVCVRLKATEDTPPPSSPKTSERSIGPTNPAEAATSRSPLLEVRFTNKGVKGERAREARLEQVRSAFSGIHPNCIAALPPSREWTVLVDETGTDFYRGGGDKEPFAKLLDRPADKLTLPGKLVALVIPSCVDFPPIPGFHAAGTNMETVPFNDFRCVVDFVRQASCGVLGVTVDSLPEFCSEQWISCIETMLEMIVRLLPLPPGENATVSFLVENRFEMDKRVVVILKTLCDNVLFRLARAFPARAERLKLSPRFVRKYESDRNGYVDAIANLWGSPSPKKERLLKETGWVGTCLLNSSCGIVHRFFDDVVQEREIRPEEWSSFLSARSTVSEAPYLDALLGLVGENVRSDHEQWKRLLDETVSHLESNAVDMALLSSQMEFLKKWEPEDADRFPPRLSLLWMTAEVARRNHLGKTREKEPLYAELVALAERLRREDRDLCVRALLNLAVSHTNAFEFAQARELLLPIRDWPPESIGLRMAGQLASSLGQHEAFLGNVGRALPLFDEAVSLFRDLSEGADGEVSRTRAYAATAAMDAKTPDADERLAAYLWGGPYSDELLAKTARSLAKVAAPEEKYKHHILLRRLVELSPDHSARMAYLEEKERWAEPPNEHPWELVEFYRALLLPVGAERTARLQSAYKIAMTDDGPTLQVIAAVILGAAFCDGDSVDREAFDRIVGHCAESLPALGEARLAALRGQLDPATRLNPLSLARAVLPFNFR